MDGLELPQSANCLVCGRTNPHGLRLRLRVDPETGLVSTDFVPGPQHVGFEGMVHGGLLATVLDEAMTWAATWKNKRFCYCGELTTRFRNPLRPGQRLRVEALVEFSRPKLVEVAGKIFDHTGRLTATSSGKYVPTSLDEHLEYMDTFLDAPATDEAARLLRGLPPAPKIEVQVMPAAQARRAEEPSESREDQPSDSTAEDEERAST